LHQKIDKFIKNKNIYLISKYIKNKLIQFIYIYFFQIFISYPRLSEKLVKWHLESAVIDSDKNIAPFSLIETFLYLKYYRKNKI
jgi:hypothetical protein